MDDVRELFQFGYDPSKTPDEMLHQNKLQPNSVLKKLIPRSNKREVLRHWKHVTSLIVVRHPLDRLVSLYNNKFVHAVKIHKLWTDYATYIEKHYREEESVEREFVSPQQMIR